MSVIFKTVKRPSDPRVENSPKRYYPQLITLGRSVDLKFIAQKIQDRSSLSVGDIKSTIQNFVEKLKEQLLEGKKVLLDELGDFWISITSMGAESCEAFTSKNITGVNIIFTPGDDFQNLIGRAEFNLVASRVAQAATLKAEKMMLDTVDLAAAKKKGSPSDSTTEEPGGETGGSETGGSETQTPSDGGEMGE